VRSILTLFAKDVLRFRRDKAALILSFVVPAMLTLLFGFLFGGGGNAGGIRLMVVDEAKTELSAKLIAALEKGKSLRVVTGTEAARDAPSQPLTRDEALRRIAEESDTWRHALILPADLVGQSTPGFRIETIDDPRSEVETSLVSGMIQKVILTRGLALLMDEYVAKAESQFGTGAIDAFHADLAGILEKRFGLSPAQARQWSGDGALTDLSGGDAGSIFNSFLHVEKTNVRGENKNYAVQNVGGWAVMFLLFTMSGAGAALLEEKHHGIYARLLSGPATRTQILWSKFAFMTALGFVQLWALFLFGHFFWHIFASPAQILPLSLVILAASAACAAIGMTMASLCRTEAQAQGVATLIILGLCAVGGAMVPLFMLPEFVQDTLAPLTPVYWAMDGCFAVLWSDGGVAGVLRHVGMLLVWVAVLMPFAFWRFRKGDLFR
jgi:ABC-2 type transport system permease protein